MGTNKLKSYPLRIEPEIIERLKKLAEENSRSLNKEIEFALKQYIKSCEEW